MNRQHEMNLLQCDLCFKGSTFLSQNLLDCTLSTVYQCLSCLSRWPRSIARSVAGLPGDPGVASLNPSSATQHSWRFSTVILILRLIQEVLLSATGKKYVNNVLLTAKRVKLAQEKCE